MAVTLYLRGLEASSWNGKGMWLSKSVKGLKSWHRAKGTFAGVEGMSVRVTDKRVWRSRVNLKTKWVWRVREKAEGMSCLGDQSNGDTIDLVEKAAVAARLGQGSQV